MQASKTLLYTSLIFSISACDSNNSNTVERPSHAYNTKLTQITKENAIQTASLSAGGITSLGQSGHNNTQLSDDIATNTSTGSLAKKFLTIATSKTVKKPFIDCDSGSVSYNIIDTNDNYRFDQSDSVSINFDECSTKTDSQDDISETTSGNIAITLNENTEEVFDTNILVKLDELTINNNQNKNTYLNGEFTFTQKLKDDISEFGISGKNCETNITDTFVVIEDFDMQVNWHELNDEWSQTANATVTSTELNGKVIISTIDPFLGSGSNNPYIGSVRIDGAQDSYMIIDADTGDLATVNLTINDGSSITTDIINWTDIQLDTFK